VTSGISGDPTCVVGQSAKGLDGLVLYLDCSVMSGITCESHGGVLCDSEMYVVRCRMVQWRPDDPRSWGLSDRAQSRSTI
jgi:hypothetical protein